VNLDSLAPLLVAAVAVGGFILAALRWNRDDASSVVQQSASVVVGMKTLMDEREEDWEKDRRELVRLRSENERLQHELDRALARLALVGGTDARS
jgi:GTP-sensing pleiotropic transcriptional regulator CodY